MALGVSEDHLELATSVRGYAERHGGPMPGLLGLPLPEESGGQGYGLGELAVALEELGDALVPGGFLPTVLANAVLERTVLASTEPVGADVDKLLRGVGGGGGGGRAPGGAAGRGGAGGAASAGGGGGGFFWGAAWPTWWCCRCWPA